MLLIVRGDFYSWCTKVGIFLKWYWTAAYLYVTSFIALIYHGCWRERTTAQDVIVFFAINMNRGNSGQSSLCMLCCGSCVCTQTSEYTVDSGELLSAGQPGKPLVHDFLVYFSTNQIKPWAMFTPHGENKWIVWFYILRGAAAHHLYLCCSFCVQTPVNSLLLYGWLWTISCLLMI